MLQTFLDAKPLYYEEIDYNRMPRVYESIRSRLRVPKIIHLIGTNGKGTTGRFLASALLSKGLSVGHYSSPHILEFNERIWLNGKNISNAALESAHLELLTLLSPQDSEALSYFEYTTFLAILLYKECDYVVFEAGLGGEHDATSVFANILTLITPIGRDHEAFLGDTIEKIATTKLRAIYKNAILAKQSQSEVAVVARRLAEEKELNIESYEALLEAEDFDKIALISKNLSLAPYLEENLSLAIAALKFLGISYEVDSFKESRLFGRLTQLRENILLDVGHNELAAQEIVKSLKGQKFTLVYNSYKDKNYRAILETLSPIIEDIEILDVDESRIENAQIMKKTVERLGFCYKKFEAINAEKRYLVFGSFSVAERFLKIYQQK